MSSVATYAWLGSYICLRILSSKPDSSSVPASPLSMQCSELAPEGYMRRSGRRKSIHSREDFGGCLFRFYRLFAFSTHYPRVEVNDADAEDVRAVLTFSNRARDILVSGPTDAVVCALIHYV